MPLDPRLETDPNLWLGEEIYILTSLQPVKNRKLLANPRASIALENGSTPLIAECAARLAPTPFSEVLFVGLRPYSPDCAFGRDK